MISACGMGMADSQQKRKRIWWILAISVLIVLIAYLMTPKPIPVRGATVTRGVLPLFLSATGIVEGQVTDVTSRLTARVIRLTVDEGDTVTRGQVLAQLETTDLQAEISRQQAAVRAVQEQAAAQRQAVASEAAQLQAAEARAQATVQNAAANLQQAQAGARVEDIATQRAAVAQARAQYNQTRAAYQRAQSLHAQGAISTQRLEEVRAANETARAQLAAQEQQLQKLQRGSRPEEIAAARAQLRAAEAALQEARAARQGLGARRREVAAAEARVREARAALQAARAQLAYATIRSPIPGIVAEKHKEVGEMATPYEPVYTVANLQYIWVTAEVDEEDVAAVAPGQRVTITLDAYPGRSATGVVTRVASVARVKELGRIRAKVVPAKIILQQNNLPLRPGIEVNVTGSLPTGRAVLLVPNDAIFRSGDQDSVYVIVQGRARMRTVTIGQSNFEQTQILAGLAAGDVVAVSNLDQLADGARVRLVK